MKLLAITLTLAALAIAATAGTARADDGGDHHGCRHQPIGTIIGTSGPDLLVGGRCSDYIYGLGGNDRLIAGSRGDHLFGGRGDDRLRGVNGWPDVLSGGRGNDRCRGDQLDLFKSCEHVLRFFIAPELLHQLRH